MSDPRDLGVEWNNHNLLNAIRNSAGLEYRDRIPKATQDNVRDIGQALQNFQPAWNLFCDALVNRIGSVILHDIIWENPLASFKRQALKFGETIEDIQYGLLKSHVYSPDKDYGEKALFGNETPPVASYFHTVNRREYYALTVNDDALRAAFLDENGLSNFVNGLMAVPALSDQWDEFLLMLSLIKKRDEATPFFRVNVPNIKGGTASEADVKKMLKSVRAMSANLRVPSERYNGTGLPSLIRPEDQILITTPEVEAAIDVDALAAAFHIDRADVTQRVISMPEEHLGLGKGQALLTSKDFWVVADTVLTNRSQPNAAGLTNKYFLHHQGIVSASRAVPAILFTTEASTPINITPPALTSRITGANVELNGQGKETITAAGEYTLKAFGDDDKVGVVTYHLSGNTNNSTRIVGDKLHVASPESGTLKIRCVNSVSEFTKQIKATVA